MSMEGGLSRIDWLRWSSYWFQPNVNCSMPLGQVIMFDDLTVAMEIVAGVKRMCRKQKFEIKANVEQMLQTENLSR